MKRKTITGIIGLCIILTVFFIINIPSVSAGVSGSLSNPMEVTTSIMFDGNHFIFKNEDTEEILKTMTPSELKTGSNLIGQKSTLNGLDNSGLITVSYDTETGEYVSTENGYVPNSMPITTSIKVDGDNYTFKNEETGKIFKTMTSSEFKLEPNLIDKKSNAQNPDMPDMITVVYDTETGNSFRTFT